MPEPDPLPVIKTPWGSATPPSGATPGDVPPIPIPDHTLIRRVGKGSYGEVWLARNVLGVYRAVKIIHRRSFDDDRPFEREFAGMQRFEPVSRSHESQLNILQVGRGPDCFYYVMELADDMGRGAAIDEASYAPRNLRSELLLRGRLPVDECVRLGLALTTALGHLHRHRLVHRDIKPSNIVFVNGIPKLADIGLVALAESTMSFVGTEGYLPPEGPGTVQADLFSLGKVLYEISTGHDRQQFPELPTGITELPDRAALAELNEVLLRACAPDVKQRYESAAEMHADLALLQSGKSVAQMRRVERRLRFVARAGAVVTGVALLAGAAFLYQQVQTSAARRLANENHALAEAKTQLADDKSKLADESRRRLVRQRVANGVRLMNAGELSQALLWFTEALPLVESDPAQARIHRIRLGGVLDEIPRLRFVLPHEESVGGCWFSPDSTSLLTLTKSVAQVWHVASGQPLSPRLLHTNLIRSGAFSPDGSRVLTGDAEGVVRVWDSTQAWQCSTLQSNTSFCLWHPNGRSILICSLDRPATLIDAENGAVLKQFQHFGAVPNGGAISPDGRLVALADSTPQVLLCDALTGARVGTLPILDQTRIAGAEAHFRGMQLHFDLKGHRLLVRTGNGQPRDERVEVWDVAEQRRLFGPTKGASGFLGDAALNPAGSQLLLVNEHDWDTGKEGHVEVWDVQSNRLIRTLSTRISGNGAMFLPEINAAAASSWDGFAQLWNPETGAQLTPPLTHRDYVLGMALSPDGNLLATAGDDAVVKLWRLNRAQPEAQRLVTPPHGDHPAAMLSAATSPDERFIVTGSCDGVARVWDTASKKLVRELRSAAAGGIVQVEWSADGATILTRERAIKQHPSPLQRARLWDADSGRMIPSPLTDALDVVASTFNLDGARVASGHTNGTVRVWDARNGVAVFPALTRREEVYCLAWSPTGQRLIAGYADGTICCVDTQSGRQIFEKQGNLAGVRAIAISPDGHQFVTVGNDQHGRIWDLATGDPSAAFKHDGSLFLAAWQPDGRRVMTSGLSRDIRTWDASTGQNVLPPMTHEMGLTSLISSRDGRLVASASSDHTARVWDVTTGEALIPPVDHGLPATVALLLDNGRRLFSAGEDGTGRFLDLAPTPLATEDLRAYAHAVSSRDIDGFEAVRKLSKEQVIEALRTVRTHQPGFFAAPKP